MHKGCDQRNGVKVQTYLWHNTKWNQGKALLRRIALRRIPIFGNSTDTAQQWCNISFCQQVGAKTKRLITDQKSVSLIFVQRQPSGAANKGYKNGYFRSDILLFGVGKRREV